MVKDDQTVIEWVLAKPALSRKMISLGLTSDQREFNEIVNMSFQELSEWLKEEASEGAGWGKGDESDETIGHERQELSYLYIALRLTKLKSGRKIVEILKKNPNKDPDKYDQGDIAHMRKVVSYNKRHLAQEGKAKQDPESRSAKSLKNWGHDPQKA